MRIRLIHRVAAAITAFVVVSFVVALLTFDRPATATVTGTGDQSIDGLYHDVGGSKFARIAPETLSRGPDVLIWRPTTTSTVVRRVEVEAPSGEAVAVWGITVSGDGEGTAARFLSTTPSIDGPWVTGSGNPAPGVRVVLRAPPVPSPAQLAAAKPSSIWARSPALRDLASKPMNSAAMLVVFGFYAYIWSNRLGYPDVGVSFSLVALREQYWRVVSASLAHVDFMHLAFNSASLYNLGSLEAEIGTVPYARATHALLFTTMLAALAIYLALIRRGKHQYLHALALGYSCILFGLMVLAALRMASFCPVPGFNSLCFTTYFLPLPGSLRLGFNLGPFILLVGIQVIVPKASFVGHLAGILAGYPLAWGALDWCTPSVLHRLLFLAVFASQAALVRTGEGRRLAALADAASSSRRGTVIARGDAAASEAELVSRAAPILIPALLAALVASVLAGLWLSPTDAVAALGSLCVLLYTGQQLRATTGDTLPHVAQCLAGVFYIAAFDAVACAVSLAAVIARRRALLAAGASPWLVHAATAAHVALLIAAATALWAALTLLRKSRAGRSLLPGSIDFWDSVERDANRMYMINGAITTEAAADSVASAQRAAGVTGPRVLGGEDA